MKKSILRVTAVLMVVCTLCSASILSSFAAPSTTRTIDNIIYYTEDGQDVGIKSIKENGTLFYDCTNNTKASVTTDFLKNYLTSTATYTDPDGKSGQITPLYEWANIASAMFENGGKYTCTDNYRQCYSPKHSTDSNEYVDVAAKLANKSPSSNGATQDDNYQSTGLCVASSFNDLRNKMCEHISDRIDRYSLEPSDILSQGDYNPDALPELSDSSSRKIIYNIVTSIARDGYTCKYKYNSYGIGFYDFDLKILDVEGVDFVTDTSKTKTDSTVKESVMNTSENQAIYDVSSQTTTEFSKSETISTSITDSESYSFDEMFGTEINMGNVGVLKSEITFAQAFESARTHETTTVSSVSQSKTVDYKVPAHTIVNVTQSITKDTMTESYDLPVALTYKVVVFSMSGDVYADSAFTLCQSTVGYEQSNFTSFFGCDSTEKGQYAYEALNNRVNYGSDTSMDGSYGNNRVFYKYHDGYSNPTDKSNYGFNWDSIVNVYNKNTNNQSDIKKLATTCPMLPTGAQTTTTVDCINTVIEDPQPMYNPSNFRVINNQQERYFIFTDGSFNLNTISIGAFDRFGAPYYDFLMKDGYWSVKDGSEDILEYNSNSNTVKAKATGTGTLVWKLKDDVKYTSAYDKDIVTCQNANPVEVTFTVRDYPLN